MKEYTHFEERAAIMEFEGNLERHEAEKFAYKDEIRRITEKKKIENNKNIIEQSKLFD